MARYKKKHFIRDGNIFTTERGLTTVDLSDVNIIHTGVDTLKIMFDGSPNQRLKEIQQEYDAGFNAIIKINGIKYKLGAAGQASGYKYKLQNNHHGLIILYRSIYNSPKFDDTYSIANHLKIECSPHYLIDRESQAVDDELFAIAETLMDNPTHKAVSVHLCADVQGWHPDSDFTDKMVTRARRNTQHIGISDIEFDLSHAAVNYNQFETVTIGSPSSTQLCVYDKSLAAHRQDKVDFWKAVWDTAHDQDGVATYRPDEQVTRIEVRFHHSVIQQFNDYLLKEEGEDTSLRTYAGISQYLNSLWFYGMQNYRLQHSSDYIDPFWQLLIEDARFTDHGIKFIKREYKKPGSGSERNISLALGNLLSLYARKQLRFKMIKIHIKRSGIWADIKEYYRDRGLDELAVWRHIQAAIEDRILDGKAA